MYGFALRPGSDDWSGVTRVGDCDTTDSKTTRAFVLAAAFEKKSGSFGCALNSAFNAVLA